MKREQLFITGAHNTILPVTLWLPEEPVRGILQITHGMTEHIGRYEALARELTAAGYVVAGFDLRGHGRHPAHSVTASFGQGGWDASLLDMGLFSDYLKNRFPGKKLFLYGFSLGSFLLRDYLARKPEGICGAVIAGTGYQPGWLLSIMMSIVSGQVKKVGFDGYSSLVRQLSFGTYNQKFKPNRTEKDWLCSDSDQISIYLKDPLCREQVSAGLFLQMLCAMKRTGRADACSHWDQSLPVLLLSGLQDPVGDMGKGAAVVYQHMKKAGLQDVKLQLFPGARHDILHEEASGTAAAARTMIRNWMDER